MIISDINPFVRFAGRFFYHPTKYEVLSYDSRIVMLLSDELKMKVGGSELNLKKGDLVYWPPGTPYIFLAPESFEVIVLDFDFDRRGTSKNKSIPTVKKEKYEKEKAIFESFSDVTLFNEPFTLEGVDFIISEAKELVRENSAKTLYYKERTSAHLKLILTDMAKTQATGSKKSLAATERIIKYIEENYARKIKNSELSELVNYHEYHINRLMKAHTGYSLHEYIIRYRVSAAKKLLLSGGKSIAEIAEETGFDSPAHFSSVFRERTGETPGAYKKKMLL